jgi:hypothetical protein
MWYRESNSNAIYISEVLLLINFCPIDVQKNVYFEDGFIRGFIIFFKNFHLREKKITKHEKTLKMCLK